MNTEPESMQADRELLALARTILASEDFAVENVDSPGLSFVLAENAYFLVAVVATPTIAQMLAAEGLAESAISDRLSKGDVGPKKWDAYLILLTQERSPETGPVTRGLFEINYDTSRLRRIAHAGVDPTNAVMETVLAPFIAPSELDDPAITESPFQALVRVLSSHGVERQLAQRAIDAFEQGVPLGNVL